MFLFTILFIMLLMLVAALVLAISLGGAVAIILFGDVIVCAVIIAYVIKRIIDKKS